MVAVGQGDIITVDVHHDLILSSLLWNLTYDEALELNSLPEGLEMLVYNGQSQKHSTEES